MTSLEGISPLFIKKSERIGGECENDDVLSIVSLLFIHINKKAVEKIWFINDFSELIAFI